MYGVREAEETFCEPNTDISCIWMSSLSNGFGRFEGVHSGCWRIRWNADGALAVQQAVNLKIRRVEVGGQWWETVETVRK